MGRPKDFVFPGKCVAEELAKCITLQEKDINFASRYHTDKHVSKKHFAKTNVPD